MGARLCSCDKIGYLSECCLRLVLPGFVQEAEEVLGKFKWGPNFLELNKDVLSLYVRCESGEEILEAQDLWLARCALETEIRKKRMLTDSLTLPAGVEGQTVPLPASSDTPHRENTAAQSSQQVEEVSSNVTASSAGSQDSEGPREKPDYEEQFQHMDAVTRGLIALTLKGKEQERHARQQEEDAGARTKDAESTGPLKSLGGSAPSSTRRVSFGGVGTARTGGESQDTEGRDCNGAEANVEEIVFDTDDAPNQLRANAATTQESEEATSTVTVTAPAEDEAKTAVHAELPPPSDVREVCRAIQY